MKLIKLTTLALSLTVIASCNNTKEESPVSLSSYLRGCVADGDILFGHHDDTVYGHSWVGDDGRSDVYETCGHFPAVLSWDLGRIELDDTVNLDRVPFERIRKEVIAQDKRGGINTFSWHPVNPVNGRDSWCTSDSTVVSQMVHDPVYKGLYRDQLIKVSAYLNSLRREDGSKIEVIFRPFHEHTGGWFWWGAPHCSVDDYKALWSMMYETLRAEGVDNVLYAYSPDRVASADEYMERYPGDDIVDIMGLDVYHFGGEDGVAEYMETVSRGLGIVRHMSLLHDKIPAFSETGLEGVTLPDWWTKVLLPVLKENPVAYVVLWRNAHDRPGHFYGPFPEHESSNYFNEFASDPIIKLL